MKAYLLLISILALGCSPGKKFEQSDDDQDKQIREMVLAKQSSSEALDLVEFVHTNTKVIGGVNDRFSKLDRAQNLYFILNDETYGHICGGIGITAVDVLRAFGYQARIVQLFSTGADGHVTTEFLKDGKWIAADPTFNLLFKDETGKLLSYKEMFDRVRAGQVYGYPERINGRTVYPVENYYFPYSGLFHKGRAMPLFERMTPAYELTFTGEEKF